MKSIILLVLVALFASVCFSQHTSTNEEIKDSIAKLTSSVISLSEEIYHANLDSSMSTGNKRSLAQANTQRFRALREDATKRKELLKALIVRDPKEALKVMLDARKLDLLKTAGNSLISAEAGVEDIAESVAVSDLFETPIDIQNAQYFVIASDNTEEEQNATVSTTEEEEEHSHEGSAEYERLVVLPETSSSPAKEYKAFVYGEQLSAISSDRVHVVGYAVDNLLAVDESSTLYDFSAKMAPSLASNMYTFGTKSLLYIRVDFSDKPGEPVSVSAMDSVLKQTQQFIAANSYGKATLGSWKITQVFRMPRTFAYYSSNANSYTQLLSDAVQAAQRAGLSSSAYSFHAVGFARLWNGWTGRGYVGRPGMWFNGAFTFRTTTHELGHNLGLWHANFYVSSQNPAVAYGGRGTVAEYGDISDIMGAGMALSNHFNLRNKIQLGWVPNTALQTVTNSGTFTIHAHDHAKSDGKLRGLKISYSRSNPNNHFYIVSFRGALNTGVYARKALDVHVSFSTYTSANSTHMVDTTPTSGGGRTDAPIALGATFTDTTASPDITIRFVSSNCPANSPCTATVSVNFGGSNTRRSSLREVQSERTPYQERVLLKRME